MPLRGGKTLSFFVGRGPVIARIRKFTKPRKTVSPTNSNSFFKTLFASYLAWCFRNSLNNLVVIPGKLAIPPEAVV